MAWLAAKTKTLGLVLSVMVVPHRPAVLAAKQLATIDILSGGRLTVGIGAGWMREEFEALQTEPFDERGAVTDEYIAAFKELWTSDDPRFEGKYVRFSNIDFTPKPVQRPHPPIWVGGESGPALRRTAKLGDVWYPIQANPAFPMDSLHAAEGRHREAAGDGGEGRARRRMRSASSSACPPRAPACPRRPATASGGCGPAATPT